jgi:hypothetical protein
MTAHLKTQFSHEPLELFKQFQELGQSIGYCGYGYGPPPPQLDTRRPNSDGYLDIWDPCMIGKNIMPVEVEGPKLVDCSYGWSERFMSLGYFMFPD